MTMQATKNQTAKHTPGPWSTEYDGSLVMCGQVVTGPIGPEGAGRDERRANGRLAAAAPDLLAALERVLAAYEAAREPGHGIILIDEARAAIAKARGK